MNALELILSKINARRDYVKPNGKVEIKMITDKYLPLISQLVHTLFQRCTVVSISEPNPHASQTIHLSCQMLKSTPDLQRMLIVHLDDIAIDPFNKKILINPT